MLRLPRLAAAVGAGCLLVACRSSAPSTLEPGGPVAERVAGAWWLMLTISSAVVAVVGILLLVAVARRRRAADPSERTAGEPRWAAALVVGGGAVVPFVILVVLWAVTLRDAAELSEPPARPALTVEVIGWRWWWDVRYPDAGAVTANEVHIPAGVPVRLRVLGGDVIHSFWVPQLGGKMDMIPGRVNEMWIQADDPGIYRGQCAEYCGVQHANMAFFVVAHPPAEFEQWLEREAADAAVPDTALEARGQQVFASGPCAGCHTIRGVAESGTLGPDLTHFGSRGWIGAGTVRSNLQNLLAWIPRSDEIKPGNLMPPIPLSTEDLEAVAAYLMSLE